MGIHKARIFREQLGDQYLNLDLGSDDRFFTIL